MKRTDAASLAPAVTLWARWSCWARRALARMLLGLASVLVGSSPAQAQATSDEQPWWDVHGQATFTSQKAGRFSSPYAGPNSLSSNGPSEETFDATLALGLRLWHGAQAYVDPEIDQGYGLDNTLGAAGFPSGEAYKLGCRNPYFRLPRAFVRQVVDLGGEPMPTGEAANQMATVTSADRLTATLGKFSVVDIFDTNAYAHDPRSDFLNWSVIEAGAFDYAADAWGYTWGASAELTEGSWSWRTGLFALSLKPNEKSIDTSFGERQWVTELEHRYGVGQHAGSVRALLFLSQARMGLYEQADRVAQLSDTAPATAEVRKRHDKAGFVLGLDQEISNSLGLFGRLSANDGRSEAYDFTEINRSVSGGAVLTGAGWGLEEDKLGLAVAINGLSPGARTYLRKGGLGILIGDGQLPQYASERIAELFYQHRLNKAIHVTLDYQRLANPAYNAQRGPASVYAARLHAEF